jgi:3D (Asp-Asp-Asp) domain-containing protein
MGIAMRLPHPISQIVSVRFINLITNIVIFIVIFGMLGVLPMHAAQNIQLTCSSSSLKFGAVAVGQTETLLVNLTNNGTSSVTLSAINLSNPEFNVVASLPTVVPAGQSLNVSVSFAPTTGGWTAGNVAFISNATNPTLKVGVSGTGNSNQAITVNPSSISFGGHGVGSFATLSLVLTNTRKWAVSVNGLQTSGAVYSISGPALPLSLAGGQSVTFNVTFAPLASGTIGGSVFVQGPSLTVPLSGTGTVAVAGQLSIAPAALSFGNVTVGNSGNAALTLSASGASVTISSEASSSGAFALAGASFPITIAAGQSVSLDVVFTPKNSGIAAGSLSFASNAGTAPPAEAVTGTGVTPVYSVGLTWSPSISEVMGYNVYRGPGVGGPFSKINSSLESVTAYTDGSVASGQTYYYVTTAVNSSNVESSPSSPAQATIP